MCSRSGRQIFAAAGRQYRHAKLVLFRDATYSGCGTAQAATGPFYCPEDEKVYIDLGFWEELKRFGGSTADFAQAYVIAHELGHHVQKLLGTEAKVTRLNSRSRASGIHLSVDLELQADCYAGCGRTARGSAASCMPATSPSAERGGGGGRRSSAEDERAGGESGELDAWIGGAENDVVQARVFERGYGQLQYVWGIGAVGGC